MYRRTRHRPVTGRRGAWVAGHLPAVAGFAALTAAFFWPVLLHLRTRVLSQGGDASTFLWSYWFMPRAALDGHSPFVTTSLFHPVGAALAFHTTTPLEMAVSWPVARLLGLGVAGNLLQLAAVVLSALGAYLLAVRICGDRRAAFFAGAAFAFAPYRFVHTGAHLNLVHAEFLPFGLLALLRLLEQPSRRRAAVLGLVVGLTFLTDFYYAVFLAIAVAVVLVARRGDVTDGVRRLLPVAAAVAVLVALPLLVAMVAGLRAGELDRLPGWGGADVYSSDVLSWVVPPEAHPWWGDHVATVRRSLPAQGEGMAYPGLLVIGLAVAGRELWNRHLRTGWVALAAVAGVLALGPFLQVHGSSGAGLSYLGRRFLIPLPYMALHFVPLLNGIRVPGRFSILAVLALDILAGVALASLMRSRPRWASVMFAGALAITMVEFLPGPLPWHPVEVPAAYHRIAADPDPGALLEVPLQWQSGSSLVGDRAANRDDTIFLYYATVHGKPLVSGYVARYPAKRLKRLTGVRVYREVLALGDEPGFDEPATFRAEDLRALGIGFVAYHRDRPQPRALAYLEALGMPVLTDDGTIVVWKVSP